MDVAFASGCWMWALRIFISEIFNSDQGVPFTTDDCTKILERESVRISMDGRGRVCVIIVESFRRTVKHGEVYVHQYLTVADVRGSLERYFHFNNTEDDSCITGL
ncbi:MAG: hypothetical protein V1766_05800 [Pseudomonadota bacterium]